MRMFSFLVVLTLLALPAVADAQDATSFVKAKHAEVEKVLRAGKVDRDKLSKALDGLLDYEAISRESLGREWDKRSTSERAAFTSRLKRLIEDNYQKNIRTTAQYKIDYEEPSEQKGRIRVPTRAQSKKNRRAPAVEIVYWLVPAETSFTVVDVETDGVGLVSTYRRQFRKILRNDGWDGLLKRMDERLSSDKS